MQKVLYVSGTGFLLFLLDLGQDGLLLIVDVHPDRSRAGFPVTASDTPVNFLMLFNQPSMLADILDVFQAIAIHLLGQVAHHLDQPVIAAGADNDIVESHIRLSNTYRILGAGHLYKSIAGPSQLPDFFLRDAFTGELYGKGT